MVKRKRKKGSGSKASSGQSKSRSAARPDRDEAKDEVEAKVKDAQKGASTEADNRWAERAKAYTLLLATGVMIFLGYAGFGIWPLAFVCMVPALFVFEQQPKGWRFFWRAMFVGYIAVYGGFYWVVDTIVDFGGFPYAIALLFASIYFLYQGLVFVLIFFLWRRARARNYSPTLSLVAAYLAVELIFPMLFDNFYGNSFHMLPWLIQVVDFGGPMLLTALAMLGNGTIYELLRARIAGRPMPRIAPATFVFTLATFMLYSQYRIADVETAMAAAPSADVGVVQTNMGIFAKWEDPAEGKRRHIEQSLTLERESQPDLLVWPESAASFFLPAEGNVSRWVLTAEDGQVIHTPTLFGGLSRREVEGEQHHYNTAFLTDENGEIQGTYDKTYLLAFGEYIPFGDIFPWVYEISENSGNFTPGNHVRPLPFELDGEQYRIGTLICYEDILPRFVSRVMQESNPHFLVNITNDAWFGESQEPYVHLALAKFRAVEQHRHLIRATNTGISAIVDPLGRVTAESPLFERASLTGEVRMLEGHYLYETLGNWPGFLGLGIIAYIAVWGRRRRDGEELLDAAQDSKAS